MLRIEIEEGVRDRDSGVLGIEIEIEGSVRVRIEIEIEGVLGLG